MAIFNSFLYVYQRVNIRSLIGWDPLSGETILNGSIQGVRLWCNPTQKQKDGFFGIAQTRLLVLYGGFRFVTWVPLNHPIMTIFRTETYWKPSFWGSPKKSRPGDPLKRCVTEGVIWLILAQLLGLFLRPKLQGVIPQESRQKWSIGKTYLHFKYLSMNLTRSHSWKLSMVPCFAHLLCEPHHKPTINPRNNINLQLSRIKHQWQFQEPNKLEIPICFRPIFVRPMGISQQHIPGKKSISSNLAWSSGEVVLVLWDSQDSIGFDSFVGSVFCRANHITT